MKKLILLLTVIVLVGVFAGCSEEESTIDSKQKAQQEQMQKDMDNAVGMPNIKNWTEKKMAKEIQELRDDPKLVCYYYTQNLYSGKFIYMGRCIGYGLPYSTQYTNPEKVGITPSYCNPYTLPQADPNGLFSQPGTNATWIRYINPDTGKSEIDYMEPNALIKASKLPKRMCEDWSLPEGY